jgi:hypothetical protein
MMSIHMIQGVSTIANTTVSYLGACIGTPRYIWNTVEEVDHRTGQLKVLADCATQHSSSQSVRRRVLSSSRARQREIPICVHIIESHNIAYFRWLPFILEV